MNPFDLKGPQFLLFYLLLGVLTLVILVRRRRARESAEGPRVNLSDPYLIAYLRGSANEALRVATVSLIDRGLLTVRDDLVAAASETAADLARRPLEKKILQFFATPGPGSSIFSSSELQAEAKALEKDLTRVGLLPDEATRRARGGRLILTVGFLWAVAFIKIVVALSRGRTNIGFLILLSIAFAVAALVLSNPRRTARGDALLADLRTLFGHLKERAASLRPGGATAEAVLLAAVFGLAALPATEWAYARTLYPKAASGSDTSSCGSSCGSSGGSSCGSSCGGGGGGGCGGCGG